MRIVSRTLGIVALSLVVSMTACKTTDTGSSTDGGGGSQTQEAEGGFRAPAEPSTSDSGSTATPTAKLELRPVYFGYDRADLTPEARASLREDAEELKSSTAVTTLEGHTDERGTFEYNIALGDRRANSVKKYLVALGMPASRLRTKSVGEANPAVKGHDESAWRWNRRVVLQQ
jgi:peptidoglycan-associated lipoprotein